MAPNTETAAAGFCGDCIYAKAHTKPGFVQCKRYPPEPLKHGVRVVPLHPAEEWCGEHPLRRAPPIVDTAA